MDVEDLAGEVWSRRPRLGETRLVAVDGPGGAGKSIYAARLAEACDAQVVRTDDFASWDNPTHWWPRLEEQVLGPIAANQAAQYRRYNWSQRRFADWHTVIPGGVLILEGVSSARAAVRDRLSLSVWVETPRRIRLERGLGRDGANSEKLWQQWMSDEDAHFASDRTREHADAVVSGVGKR
ncbi:uridine kinase [Mycobacterium sp. SA01]|uniref:uridine kinase family protein n=1 Tax=Mycobacterium sp. SA01 TaxID=3238820 RepID=UPI00351ABE77